MPWYRLHNGSLTTVIWRWLGKLYITHFQFSLVKNIFADAVLRRADPKRDHHRVNGASLRLTSHWRRPCGRPRTSWIVAIDTDVQSVNIGIHSAWRKAGDRTLWWHVVDTTTLPSWGTCHWREFCTPLPAAPGQLPPYPTSYVTVMTTNQHHQTITVRDVSEIDSKFEGRRNLTNIGKSEIRQNRFRRIFIYHS